MIRMTYNVLLKLNIMKWTLLLLLCITTPILGQQTFSKIIDIDTNAIRNIIRDFVIIDNHLFTFSVSYCYQGERQYRSCVALTKFNMNGIVIDNIMFDTLDASNCCNDGLTNDGKSFIMSCYVWGEFNLPGEYDKISTLKFDTGLQLLNVDKYDEAGHTSSGLRTSGIEVINDDAYLYGSINNITGEPDSVFIIKTDLEGNELNRFYYSYGNSSLQINNFQATSDGNFTFILKIKAPPGSNSGFSGYQLMKIDTFGNVLDSFVFEDDTRQPNRLLTTSDGGYVFSSIQHPFDGVDIFTTGYGLINKMDPEMDTLEWSLILPNDQLVDGRHYRIWDYIEAQNGDIIACGMAYDNTDSELGTGISDKNSTWNGFIVRISPEGNIVWLHLYKTPNNLLPNEEYGRFRPSNLNKIIELPDGRLVAAGIVFINGSQSTALDEFDTEAFHLWILTVDENGCLAAYDCNEIIRINSDFTKEYDIGNQWVYEEVHHIGDGNNNIDFTSFEIQDTLFDGTNKKYILNNEDTFYIENDKMYFWDEYYQEYVMYYDWEETNSYDIKYYDQFRNSEEVATVMIDSISYKHFGDDSLKVQHVRILNSGTKDEYKDVVYEGVGAGFYGIKFLLGCGLCDNNPQTTKLRCFITDSMTYHFVPYSCDSSWIMTGTNNPIVNNITIYPNPATQKVHIRGININVKYELYSVDGKFIDSGKTIGKSISLPSTPGVYFLRLKLRDEWVEKKVLSIDY